MATRPRLTFDVNEIKGTKNADMPSGAYGRVNGIHGGEGDDGGQRIGNGNLAPELVTRIEGLHQLDAGDFLP